MKTKSLSIFFVVLFVVEMNLGAEEDNNKDKEGENFEYKKMGDEHANEANFWLKAVLIGNSNVGKSALITKICKNEFLENYISTLGFERFGLIFKIVSDKDEPVLKCQIWDCCGGELYRSLVTNLCQDARVFLLAYDVTNEESFKNIENWVNGVKLHKTEKHIHFVLIGTKIDLKDNRKVPKEAGENFAKTNNMRFVEVSAKTGAGIKELEYILAKISYEEFKKDNIYEEFKKDNIYEEFKKDNIYEEIKKNKKKKEKKDENDEKSDFVEYNKSTSSLCDCCKKICENC